jgi:hypothetical protein
MGIGMLPEAIQTIVVVVGMTVFGLTMAARRYPQVEWLQHFRVRDMRTEEQKRRARRRANIMGGAQMILLGLAIPPGYAILDLMLFSSMSQLELIIVCAVALVCIGIGITAIVRSRTA